MAVAGIGVDQYGVHSRSVVQPDRLNPHLPTIYGSPPDSPISYRPGAGDSFDDPMIDEELYRPAPMGEGVRLPVPHRHPVQPAPPAYDPNPPPPHPMTLADRLVGRVLMDRGLGVYADPGLIRTTQLEIAEAYNLTPEEINKAARELVRASPRHYEHMGGLGPGEIQDFNQYSAQGLLKRRVPPTSDGSVELDSPSYDSALSYPMPSLQASPGGGPPSPNPARLDDLMYVTTL